MTKVQQVRREFGESFREVVEGFAVMGYSRRATAAILEINLSHFRQLCDRFNLHQHFRAQKDMRPECRGGGAGWPKGKKRDKPLRYSDEYLLSLMRRHDDLTFQTFEGLAPVSASTVQRRFGSWNNARRLAEARSAAQ